MPSPEGSVYQPSPNPSALSAPISYTLGPLPPARSRASKLWRITLRDGRVTKSAARMGLPRYAVKRHIPAAVASGTAARHLFCVGRKTNAIASKNHTARRGSERGRQPRMRSERLCARPSKGAVCVPDAGWRLPRRWVGSSGLASTTGSRGCSGPQLTRAHLPAPLAARGRCRSAQPTTCSSTCPAAPGPAHACVPGADLQRLYIFQYCAVGGRAAAPQPAVSPQPARSS